MTNEQLILTPIKELDDEQFIKAYSFRCNIARERDEIILPLLDFLQLCVQNRIINITRANNLKKEYCYVLTESGELKKFT